MVRGGRGVVGWGRGLFAFDKRCLKYLLFGLDLLCVKTKQGPRDSGFEWLKRTWVEI